MAQIYYFILNSLVIFLGNLLFFYEIHSSFFFLIKSTIFEIHYKYGLINNSNIKNIFV